MAKLSVVVVTRNEEDLIGQCLESVNWADEIIVVDSQSTDKTVVVARRYTDKVFVIKKNVPDANINKQFGMEKAIGDWILFLDADEIVTSEVRDEIEEILKKDDKTFDGYLVLRKNLFLGKWMKHGGWWGYAANVELVRNGKGRWPVGMHETLRVDGNVGYLRNAVIHNTHRSISQWIDKMNEYTSVEADEMHAEGKNFKAGHAIFYPAVVFLRNYFMKRGFKDGFHGLVAAVLASYYEFVRNVKLWEKQVKKQ